jgi:hypothetical protein
VSNAINGRRPLSIVRTLALPVRVVSVAPSILDVVSEFLTNFVHVEYKGRVFIVEGRELL